MVLMMDSMAMRFLGTCGSLQSHAPLGIFIRRANIGVRNINGKANNQLPAH